jgi:DNA-binding IclR family transcriptional regulator
VGKLYLASLSEDMLDDYLSKPLTAESPESITDPKVLRQEIDQAKKSGIAFNFREHRVEWSGVSVAVKNEQGRDLAYVNATVSSHLVSREELHAFAPFMKSIAQRMSDRLIQRNG